MSNGLLIYLTVVGVLALLLVLRVWWWLRVTEARNLERLQDRATWLPVNTSSPISDPESAGEEQAVAQISTRFSVTRRLLIPLVVVFAGFIAAIPLLDMIPAAVVSLAVGAVTVVGGLALRPVIENSIAGLVISASRLINVGDTLSIDGQYGYVEDITVTHTTIKLWDWRRYVVSNSKMLQTTFVNYSLHDNYVWAMVEIWIDYAADLGEVERMAREVAAASPAFRNYEPCRFWLIDTTPEGVKCWVAAWTDSPAACWRLQHDLRAGLIPRLAERGWVPRRHYVELVDRTTPPRPAPPNDP